MNIITIISTIFMVIKITVMGIFLMLLELMIAMRNVMRNIINGKPNN